jgi:hypothetical protein
MNTYPKILGAGIPDEQECVAWDKLDGSNLRFEYSHKRGWYKFGTRWQMIDESHSEYGIGIKIFLKKYGEDLARIFRDKFKKTDRFLVYGEFFGPHSFAGKHDPGFLGVQSNDPKDVVIFDVNPNKKGFLSPEEFLKYFGNLHIPKIIYTGPFTEEFVQDIRAGKYPVTDEGVVAKGGKYPHHMWMKKVKTDKYKAKLARVFGNSWENYWE